MPLLSSLTSQIYRPGFKEPFIEPLGALSVGGNFFLNNTTFYSKTSVPNNISGEGISVNSDGSKLYIIAITGVIYEYDLSTNYDITSISYNNVSYDVSSTTGTTSANRDLWFDPTGTKLYTLSSATTSTNRIWEFSLSSAFDLSTISYTSRVFTFSNAVDINHFGFALSSTGHKMFAVAASGDYVYQYSLATNWQINSASYDSVSLYIGNLESSPECIYISDDGTKLLLSGTSYDAILEYEMSEAWNLSTATFTNRRIRLNITTMTTTSKGIFFIGNNLYLSSNSPTNSIIQFKRGSNLTNRILSNSNYISVGNADTPKPSILFNGDGTKCFILKNTTFYSYTCSPAYDITTMVYDNVTYAAEDSGSDQTIDQVAFFGKNGTKYYLCGYNNNLIQEYDLSTPYDLSTRTYLQNRTFGSTSGGINIGSVGANFDFKITSDGTKFFVSTNNTSYGGYGIYRADFGTAWDISTLSTNLNESRNKFINSNFSLSSTYMQFGFNLTGKKLYVFDRTNFNLHQFNLSESYNLGTASLSVTYPIGYLDSSTSTAMSLQEEIGRFYHFGSNYDILSEFLV